MSNGVVTSLQDPSVQTRGEVESIWRLDSEKKTRIERPMISHYIFSRLHTRESAKDCIVMNDVLSPGAAMWC